ncbi:MAG: GRAM domain-containing protein [Thermoleophilaceae bacterium]
MDTPLEPGETIVKEGRANLMRGAEVVGGRLCLTDRRLVFESHALNVQRGPALVALSDVAGLDKVWTRVFGLIPLTPNGLAVRSSDGQELRFVVSGRSKWTDAIEAAASGRSGADR